MHNAYLTKANCTTTFTVRYFFTSENLPEYYDVLDYGEKHEDDTSQHPNIDGLHIADLRHGLAEK